MRFLPIVLVIVVCLLPQVQCSKSPTTPKLGIIAVFVHSEGNSPVGGITVDLLQTNESKMTDSTGIAAFEVNPGAYTVRVHDLQSGGPVLRTVDSTIQVMRSQVDTLKYFDCLMCL